MRDTERTLTDADGDRIVAGLLTTLTARFGPPEIPAADDVTKANSRLSATSRVNSASQDW